MLGTVKPWWLVRALVVVEASLTHESMSYFLKTLFWLVENLPCQGAWHSLESSN
jgi:hypothetical protein